MKIYLYKSPGKQYGLHFYGISAEDKRRVRSFLNYNHSYSDAPHHATVRPAQIFFQGDQDGWMFIEFWSEEAKWRPLVELLRSELKLSILEKKPEPHND